MELKEAIAIIRGKIKTITVISLLTALSALLFSAIQPVAYETSLSLLVAKEGTQGTDDFKYDGYYAFQTSEVLSDSIGQWMKSPETVNEIYKEAGISPDFKNLKSYSGKFTAKKMSSQYIEVKFKTAKKEEAEKLSSAITKVINEKTRKIQEDSEQEISFRVNSGNPVILETKPDIPVNSAIGLISGAIIGIFFAFIKEYFKK